MTEQSDEVLSGIAGVLQQHLDESGNVIGKSKPLSGDAVDAPVAWELAPELSQGVVQLRFTLNNVDVFSLRFD